MTDYNERENELVKKTSDMLYRFLNGEKFSHTEVVEKAEQLLSITYSGGKANSNYQKILDAVVNRYEIEVGIKTFAPTILSNDKQSRYWLNKVKPNISHAYFDRYKLFLSKDDFPQPIIDRIESDIEKTLSNCANPRTEMGVDKKRGLVMGDVQSGKTANYLGLINMAFDYGYRIVVLLAGTTNSLRLQTQKRADSGVIGAISDSIGNAVEYIGVGFDTSEHYAVPFTNRKNDFKKFIQQNLNAGIGDFNKPVVLVVKKVKSILESVADRLQAALDEKGLDTKSVLIIDDESDNASVNTTKEGSTINRCIRAIFNKFPIASYVGYTATPFENIFINPYDEDEANLDLFPSDFIVQLHAPSTYFGGRKVFPKNSEELPLCLRVINEEEPNFLPPDHEKTVIYPGLPESLKEAIHAFLINCVIRTLRGKSKKHRTLMINITRFNDVQDQIRDYVENDIGLLSNAIEQLSEKSEEEFVANERLKKIHDLYFSEFYHDIRDGKTEYKFEPVTWMDIQHGLYDEIKQVMTVVINSKNGKMSKRDDTGKDKRFDYEDYKDSGARVIAIGGMVLSRGLTLEGLMISYYSRNAGAYDTLLQMCRWFGYRPGYEDLCRVYLTQDSIDRFDAVLDAVEDLKEQISEMERNDKKPKDFGFMIKESPETLETSLLITARNKMRGTETIQYHLNYGGVYADTSKLSTEVPANLHNGIAVDAFVSAQQFRTEQGYYMASHVGKFDVADLIRMLKIPYVNKKFDTEGLAEYIENSEVFPEWDVVIATGSSKKVKCHGENGVQRSFHVKNAKDQYIRIGGSNNRVLDPSTFNAGLWLSKEKEQFILSEKSRKDPQGRTFTTLSADDYLQMRETPILVIYPIELKEEASKAEERDYSSIELQKLLETKREIIGKINADGVPLYAFAIGFPKKENGVTITYRANKIKLDEISADMETESETEAEEEDDND